MFETNFQMVVSNKACMNIMQKMHAVGFIQIGFLSILLAENVAENLLKMEITLSVLTH